MNPGIKNPKMSRNVTMENNPRWNGGKMIDKNGYILIKCKEHPFANNSGYVREHRLVMEKYLGRYLNAGEIVHHMNHNRQDNRIDNLLLLDSPAEHMKQDRTGRKYPRKNAVWFVCKTCGKHFYKSAYWKHKVVNYCSWQCRYPK